MAETQEINTAVRSLFLELLKAAIWDRPVDTSMFRGLTPKTWQAISDIAFQQSVDALIADKVISLPADCLPKPVQTAFFMTRMEQVQARNIELDAALVKVAEAYRAQSLSFLLLKGHANSVNYPKPALRTLGDIDLYLYNAKDYNAANVWAKNMGYRMEPESMHHRSFNIGTVHVENHKYITHFGTEKYNKLLAKKMKEVMASDKFGEISINNTVIKTLPVEINAFFIFQHLFHHFLELGVGLRQFCDWVLLLSKNHENIDRESFTHLASMFDLLKPMQVFASAAIKYLDAPEYIFPFQVVNYENYADAVVADIFEAGNFGHYKRMEEKPIGKWPGKWYSFVFTAKRSRKFSDVAPAHFKFLPFKKIVLYAKLKLKKQEK